MLFLILYSIISFNNRFPYEDYYFTSLNKEMGAIKAMVYIYNIYSARWSAHTFAFFFSQFYQSNIFLPTFNIITLLVLIISFFILLKRIVVEILGFNITTGVVILYSILFTCGFFLSSYNIGQTWFWYMVNWMYLWSIIAGNFLLWVLLS